MAVTPLTEGQRDAVEALIAAGRIEPVPVDLVRASAFFHQAQNSLADLDNVKVVQNLYSLAYGAGHSAGEALLSAYGYRTTNRAGQHEALIRFLAAVLSDPAEKQAARDFERMRRARNQFQYEARPPSEADARTAVLTAVALVGAARDRGVM